MGFVLRAHATGANTSPFRSEDGIIRPMSVTRIADAAAALISGGKASRLDGRVKALIEIDGRTILQRQLDVLEPRFSAIAVAANDATPYDSAGLPVLADQVLGQGPLAGIASALRWCRRPYLLAVAGDMPFVDPRVLGMILGRRWPGVDVIAPFVGDRPQPLFTLYARRCLPVVERRLAEGKLEAAGLILDEGLHVRRVYEAELRCIDSDLRCFTNINTTADLP